MKKITLAVLAVSSLSCTAEAQAQYADPYGMAPSNQQQYTPEQLQSVADTQRQQGLADCMANHSQDATTLRDCNFAVENQYQIMISNIPGSMPIPSNTGIASEVVVDVADSFYEDKGPSNKGFMNSDLE